MRAAKMAAEVFRLRMDRELQDAAGTIPNTDRQTDRQDRQKQIPSKLPHTIFYIGDML